MSNNVFSTQYDVSHEKEIKNKLEQLGFNFRTINYAFWQARNNVYSITFYKRAYRDRGYDYIQKYRDLGDAAK